MSQSQHCCFIELCNAAKMAWSKYFVIQVFLYPTLPRVGFQQFNVKTDWLAPIVVLYFMEECYY